MSRAKGGGGEREPNGVLEAANLAVAGFISLPAATDVNAKSTHWGHQVNLDSQNRQGRQNWQRAENRHKLGRDWSGISAKNGAGAIHSRQSDVGHSRRQAGHKRTRHGHSTSY